MWSALGPTRNSSTAGGKNMYFILFFLRVLFLVCFLYSTMCRMACRVMLPFQSDKVNTDLFHFWFARGLLFINPRRGLSTLASSNHSSPNKQGLVLQAMAFVIIGVHIQFCYGYFIFVSFPPQVNFALHWFPTSWAICSNLRLITHNLIDEVLWPAVRFALTVKPRTRWKLRRHVLTPWSWCGLFWWWSEINSLLTARGEACFTVVNGDD